MMRGARSCRNFAGMFGRKARPQAASARFFPAKTQAQFMAEHRSQNLFTRSQALGIMTASKTGAAAEALRTPEAESESNFGMVTPEEDGEEDDSHIMTTLETRQETRPVRLSRQEVEKYVKEAVERHVEFDAGADWKKVEFASLSVKFRVVRDAMQSCNIVLPNVELTNVVDVRDLIKALQSAFKRRDDDWWAGRDPVQEMFNSQSRPPNVYFVPFVPTREPEGRYKKVRRGSGIRMKSQKPLAIPVKYVPYKRWTHIKM
ncbi:hypothetical protein HK097_011182 [Rhizophlyctis rosea]|uniref:Large ribosomal subunit protein mL50 n=1 Tax=Rhizophlyctis rosea TaxID=64517 RepID=A0AAD5X573_9FUNG|nr:hypothetical protein HK097_011182 [Rhizophlyctis rosea]